MHFFKVPKLGSYLAVALEYDSCLAEGALDKAYEDFKQCKIDEEEQEKERKNFEDEELKKKEEEEEYEIQQFQGKDIKPKAFDATKESYVVCLDTLGQDRAFTEEEQKSALRIVRDYAQKWREIEESNLKGDIQKRLDDHQEEAEFKDPDL